MKRSLLPFSIVFFSILRVVSLSSCANIIPPGGGPRDSLPPRLVMALPKDSAINVTAKNITLTFDEYITLLNPQENLIISPTLKSFPQMDYKLRNVTIKLKDSLEPNTTYSFDFGESVRDVNESNIAKNLIYVFSTGNKIEEQTYSGKVILAETGKTDSTLLVVLHKNMSDTAILKDRPRYYTRINGKGEFMFRHLPTGDFSVFVIEGQNNFTKTYSDSTRLFAFKKSRVVINENTIPDTLFAFQEYKPKEKPGAAASPTKSSPINKEDKRLKYTLSLESGQQDLLSDLTLTFNRKLSVFDSSGFNVYDTGYHKLSGYTVSLDTGKTTLTLKNKWKENTGLLVLIDKSAVADSAGTGLTKKDTIGFFTKRAADYGSIRIRFTNLDLSKNPVLQIVQSDKIVESVTLTNHEFVRKMYRPGIYDLRVLFDANKNGSWDTGHFGTKQQPEIVQRLPQPINIRGNWDNEVTVTL